MSKTIEKILQKMFDEVTHEDFDSPLYDASETINDIETLITQSNPQLLDTLEKEISKFKVLRFDGEQGYYLHISDIKTLIGNLKKGL